MNASPYVRVVEIEIDFGAPPISNLNGNRSVLLTGFDGKPENTGLACGYTFYSPLRTHSIL
jgi:hypothetical protein